MTAKLLKKSNQYYKRSKDFLNSTTDSDSEFIVKRVYWSHTSDLVYKLQDLLDRLVLVSRAKG